MLSAIEDRVITMEPEEAKAQLKEYRREIHKRADAEYEAIADGLEAIADGRRVVDVREAIIGGGFHENGLPRLAIARADRRQIHAEWNRWGARSTLTFDANAAQGRIFETLQVTITVPPEQAPPRTDSDWRFGFSLVPIIPARVRRESGVTASRDREHFILWEVERWEPQRRTLRPDRDPYLLRHLGGDLYVIMGEWDLTPLERAVMAGRRDS